VKDFVLSPIRRLALAATLAPALLSSAPAFALDCSRATTASEQAICADGAARDADMALGKVFETARSAMPANERTALVAAERRWIERRDANCATATGSALSACLRDETNARIAYLTGAPMAGAGSPHALVPFLRQQQGGKGRADINIQLLRFAAPATAGEKAFNAEITRLARTHEPEKDDPQADHFTFEWSMTLPYASSRLISAHASGALYTGGAHPNQFTANFNLDVRRQHLLTFNDLVAAPAAKTIVALCMEQVSEQKRERSVNEHWSDVPQASIDTIAEATNDLKAWSFGKDTATIDYDPYAVGSYAEGTYTCKIPYTTLRPLAKPDFPLP
jgi:uncharacterized protein YecT (DUF1311 family)